MDTELTDLGEYEQKIKSLHRECCEVEFSPTPEYRRDIDSLLFFISDELSYRKRVNSLLTVSISDSTGEVVGIEIKGFKQVIDNMQRFGSDWIVHEHPSLGFWLGIAVNTPDDGMGWIDSELPGIEKYSQVGIPQECYEFA